VILAAVAVVGAFYWFLFRSRWGKDVYAVAFNPESAALLGIDVRRTVVMVWVLAALLAAVSGILVGPLVTVQPHMGLIFTVKALAVASLGGFANPLGILVGLPTLTWFSAFYLNGAGWSVVPTALPTLDDVRNSFSLPALGATAPTVDPAYPLGIASGDPGPDGTVLWTMRTGNTYTGTVTTRAGAQTLETLLFTITAPSVGSWRRCRPTMMGAPGSALRVNIAAKSGVG
jgi:hypothetical protein